MKEEALRLVESDVEQATEFMMEAKQRALVLSAFSIIEEMHEQGLISDKEFVYVKKKYKV